MGISGRTKARLVGALVLCLFTFAGVMAANEKPQHWSPEAMEGWLAAHPDSVGPPPWALPQGPIYIVFGFLAGLFVFSVIFLGTRKLSISRKQTCIRKTRRGKRHE